MTGRLSPPQHHLFRDANTHPAPHGWRYGEPKKGNSYTIEVEAEVAYYDEKLLSLAEAHPECQRLLTIPGMGPITATALIAAVGDVTSED
jgi:Transposase IS116/IS110/IS902 family